MTVHLVYLVYLVCLVCLGDVRRCEHFFPNNQTDQTDNASRLTCGMGATWRRSLQRFFVCTS